MDVLPNAIYAREAFLPMSLPVKHLPRNYVPFVDVTDARNIDYECVRLGTRRIDPKRRRLAQAAGLIRRAMTLLLY